MSLFELAAALLAITGVFAWVNHRFVGLPQSIALLLIGLIASVLLLCVEFLFPQITVYQQLTDLVRKVNFQQTVLQGILGFVLFAGGLHADVLRLKQRAVSVGLMATLGVTISMAVVGVGAWGAAGLFGLGLPLAWALVFGALISPTDPVAVLSTLRQVRVPETIESDMAGESMFNDGIGIVAFTVLLAIAGNSEAGGVTALQIAELFFQEALGGALLGLLCGYVAYLGIRTIDDFPIEILMSLALVTATYALATRLHMSGPISVVVAGLVLGHRGPRDAMSEQTKRALFGFWRVIDQILNAVLFLLIGLEVMVLRFELAFAWMMAIGILLVFAGRCMAVIIPVLLLRRWHFFARGTIPVLIWGGLRGGISVALALSMPESQNKALLLAMTYTVVLFTIIVQGLSLGAVITRVVHRPQIRTGTADGRTESSTQG